MELGAQPQKGDTYNSRLTQLSHITEKAINTINKIGKNKDKKEKPSSITTTDKIINNHKHTWHIYSWHNQYKSNETYMA